MNDETAEYRLLAALIDHNEYLHRIHESYFTGIRVPIFHAMERAFSTYGAITSEGVENFFERTLPQQIEMARGAKPEPVIDRLKNLALKRQLMETRSELDNAISRTVVDRDEIMRILTFRTTVVEDDTSIIPGINTFSTKLANKANGRYKFIRTGIGFLDYMMNNEWLRGGLTVVVAGSGGGKSALVVNSMLNMARMANPIASLFISMEMSKDANISRMVANLAEVNSTGLQTGELKPDEVERVNTAMGAVQELQEYMFIHHNHRATLNEILFQMRNHVEQHHVEAIFIDYLQLVPYDKKSGLDTDLLGDIAQEFRNFAEDYGVAVILLSQQNRGHNGLQSILGSGRVGHIADTVFEVILAEGGTDNVRNGEIAFWKNRNGRIGTCPVIYRPQYLRFE